MDRREEAGSRAPRDQEARAIQDVAVDAIQDGSPPADPQDVELLARAIASQGLLQPIIVVRRPDDTGFDVLAGHMRLLACKRLGWKTIPAVVRGAPRTAPPPERPPA
jgi:ParB/RepB/Spo0J family partition protein